MGISECGNVQVFARRFQGSRKTLLCPDIAGRNSVARLRTDFSCLETLFLSNLRACCSQKPLFANLDFLWVQTAGRALGIHLLSWFQLSQTTSLPPSHNRDDSLLICERGRASLLRPPILRTAISIQR